MTDVVSTDPTDLVVSNQYQQLDPIALRLLVQGMCLPSGLSAEEQAERMSLALDQLANLKPKGAAEGMLTVQMLITHEAAMDCLRRALAANDSASRDIHYRMSVKLLSTFERQLALLDRHRGLGQPNVFVENVHVAEGGNAIVGNVSHGGRPGAETGARPEVLGWVRREAAG